MLNLDAANRGAMVQRLGLVSFKDAAGVQLPLAPPIDRELEAIVQDWGRRFDEAIAALLEGKP